MDRGAGDSEQKVVRHQRVTEHLANERTHLAYIRTAIAIISLGIAINRFSLYLTQIQKGPRRPHWGLQNAETLGIGLVVFGMVLMVGAAIRYGRAERQIDHGDYQPNRIMVYLITLLVLVIGAAGLVWLFQR